MQSNGCQSQPPSCRLELCTRTRWRRATAAAAASTAATAAAAGPPRAGTAPEGVAKAWEDLGMHSAQAVLNGCVGVWAGGRGNMGAQWMIEARQGACGWSSGQTIHNFSAAVQEQWQLQPGSAPPPPPCAHVSASPSRTRTMELCLMAGLLRRGGV